MASVALVVAHTGHECTITVEPSLADVAEQVDINGGVPPAYQMLLLRRADDGVWVPFSVEDVARSSHIVVFDRRRVAPTPAAPAPAADIPPLQPEVLHIPALVPPAPVTVGGGGGGGGANGQEADENAALTEAAAVLGVWAGEGVREHHGGGSVPEQAGGEMAALAGAVATLQTIRRWGWAYREVCAALAEGAEERAESLRGGMHQVRRQGLAVAAAAGQTLSKCAELTAAAQATATWLHCAVLPAAGAAAASADAWLDNARGTTLWPPHATMLGDGSGTLLHALPLAFIREALDSRLPAAVAGVHTASHALQARLATMHAMLPPLVAEVGGEGHAPPATTMTTSAEPAPLLPHANLHGAHHNVAHGVDASLAARVAHDVKAGAPDATAFPPAIGQGASMPSLQSCQLAMSQLWTEARALASSQSRDCSGVLDGLIGRVTALIAQLLAGAVTVPDAAPRIAALRDVMTPAGATLGTGMGSTTVAGSTAAGVGADGEAATTLPGILATMSARDAELARLQGDGQRVMARASDAVDGFMRRVVAVVQSAAAAVADATATAGAAGKQASLLTVEVETLGRMPAAYQALLHEVARRHAFNTRLEKALGDMVAMLQAMTETETKTRAAFAERHGISLPAALLMGMDGQPPTIRVQVVPTASSTSGTTTTAMPTAAPITLTGLDALHRDLPKPVYAALTSRGDTTAPAPSPSLLNQPAITAPTPTPATAAATSGATSGAAAEMASIAAVARVPKAFAHRVALQHALTMHASELDLPPAVTALAAEGGTPSHTPGAGSTARAVRASMSFTQDEMDALHLALEAAEQGAMEGLGGVGPAGMAAMLPTEPTPVVQAPPDSVAPYDKVDARAAGVPMGGEGAMITIPGAAVMAPVSVAPHHLLQRDVAGVVTALTLLKSRYATLTCDVRSKYVKIGGYEVGDVVLFLPVGRSDARGMRTYLAFHATPPPATPYYLHPASTNAFRSGSRWPDYIIGTITAIMRCEVVAGCGPGEGEGTATPASAGGSPTAAGAPSALHPASPSTRSTASTGTPPWRPTPSQPPAPGATGGGVQLSFVEALGLARLDGGKAATTTTKTRSLSHGSGGGGTSGESPVMSSDRGAMPPIIQPTVLGSTHHGTTGSGGSGNGSPFTTHAFTPNVGLTSTTATMPSTTACDINGANPFHLPAGTVYYTLTAVPPPSSSRPPPTATTSTGTPILLPRQISMAAPLTSTTA